MTTIGFVDAIAKLAKVDLFARDPKSGAVTSGLFVGRPFYLDYDKASILVADSWKNTAGGLPQGAFLLAYYENEADVCEAVLLRVLGPTPLPTDRDVISSMVEYYKDDLKTTGNPGLEPTSRTSTARTTTELLSPTRLCWSTSSTSEREPT